MAKAKTAKAELIAIDSLEACNMVLGRIAAAQAAIAEIQGLAEEQRQKIDALTMTELQPHVDLIAGYEKNLLAYIAKNKKKLFVERKSLDFVFGKIGIRVSSLIETSKTTLAKLKKISGGEAAIIIKESPNKNVLASWSETQLARVDAKRVNAEEPFYKVNDSGVAEKQANSKRG